MISPSAEPTTATTTQRVGWVILIVATLYVCYFGHLAVIGFVGPDEPRYAWIGRDMAQSGDWVTPRLYGKPWFEKPPLLYWGGALFFDLIGEGHPEVAARLPSAISALLATLALAWLAWRTYGEECARWLLLLLPTSVGMTGFSHAAATDMPFAGMLTIAMVCAAVVLGLARTPDDTPILPYTPWVALIFFGFSLGLAVLAKGPAAIILSGGAVFFWAIFAKRWRDTFRLLHPVAVAAFCVTALPWYILCARRNPDFFRVFIIEHNFKRYLTPEFQHIQPFWFYVPVLLIAFLPWMALVAWSIYAGSLTWRETKKINPLTMLFLCWSGFCLVFFSISRSKLPGYVLPSIPAMGVLLARTAQVSRANRLTSFRVCLVIWTASLAVAFLFFFALGRAIEHHSHINGRAAAALSWICLLFCLANAFLALTRWSAASSWRVHSQFAVVLPLLVVLSFVPTFANAAFSYDPSGRTLADELLPLRVNSENIYLGYMNRGQHYSLNFYLRREILDWDNAKPAAGFLLLRFRNCTEQVQSPYTCSPAPVYLERSGKFLYQITRSDSLPRLGSGRKPD